MASYDEIVLGEDETFERHLGSGDVLSDVLIDASAHRADIFIRASGSGWEIRNVGIRGQINIGDASTDYIHPHQTGGSSQVMRLSGNGLVENVYFGEGVENGVDKTAILVSTDHSGHIDVRNVYCQDFSTNMFYVAGFGRAGTGGSMRFENCYTANGNVAHYRVDDNIELVNCVLENTNEPPVVVSGHSGGSHVIKADGIRSTEQETGTSHVVTARDCDIDITHDNTCNTPWNYSSCSGDAVNARYSTVRLENCQVRGNVDGHVDRSNVGSNPDTTPPSQAPQSAEEAASGGGPECTSDADCGPFEVCEGQECVPEAMDHTLTIEGVEGAPVGMTYTFAAEGGIRGTADSELGAGGNDSITQLSDGTWEATGVTSGGYVDAYEFNGQALEFTHDASQGDIQLYLDDQAVTVDELLNTTDPDPDPVNPCADMSCPDGQVCEDGACVDAPSTNPCADVTCGAGEVCQDGACVPVQTGGGSNTLLVLAALAGAGYVIGTRYDSE